MFNENQLKIILQLLGNATFKTPEAKLAVEVLEICEICKKELNNSACVGAGE